MNIYIDKLINQVFEGLKYKHPNLKISKNYTVGFTATKNGEKLEFFHGGMALEILDERMFKVFKTSEELVYYNGLFNNKVLDFINSKITNNTNTFYCNPSNMFIMEKDRDMLKAVTTITANFRFALGSLLFKPETLLCTTYKESLPKLKTTLLLPD